MDTGIFIGDKIITTSWDKIWDKPNTLSGYGITDAVTIDTAQEIYGIKTFKSTTTISTALDVKLILQALDADNYCMIKVQDQNSQDLSYIGYLGNNWYTDGNLILNSSNYTGELDNRYVNKAGDTMTGKLLFNADSGIDLTSIPRTKSAISFNNAGSNRIGINFTDGDGNLRIARIDINQDWVSGDVNILLGSNNYEVWHAGNDGSGSGLDADLLDGYHYYSFESYHKVSIDTTGLDNNTWYPVTMRIDNSLQTRIRVQGNTYAPGSWNGREDKRMSLILDYTVNGSSWGWTSARRVINEIQDGAGAQGAHCIGGLGQLTNSSTEYVYVRGGAVYDFYVDRFINPVLRTSTYTIENQSVSPQTSYSYVNRTNALLTDNVASATKLQTPRTIFSKPFDGTSNVTGGAKFNSICIETDNNGNDNGRGSEINNYNSHLYLQHASSNNLICCMGGGQVGIHTTSPKYTLHVDGVIYAKDGFRETSDIRKKKVLSPHTVDLDVMAYADLFDYTLIDDEKEIVRVGTNAHYWLDKLPQVVTKDNDEYLSLNYGVLGTVCALSVSKYVKQLEDRVTLLENKIASLQ